MKSLADLIETALTPRRICSTQHVGTTVSGGFLLGNSRGHGPDSTPIYLVNSDVRKHVYAVGSSGCGKSNLIVRKVGDEWESGRNAIVVDLRGDLVDRIIRRIPLAAIESGRVHLLDFRSGTTFVPFNPLIGSSSPHQRALHLLEVIHQGASSWGVQLDETLRFSLVALAEAGGSLLEIEPLLTDPTARYTILRKCSDEQVLRFFSRFDTLSAERQYNWTLPVLNKLSHFWTVPQVRATLRSRQTIEWRDWIDKPGHLVLVALAAHRSPGVAQTMGGLIVASLQDAVMARADAEEVHRVPVTLYIDEFETMATPTFNTIVAEGRRFGLSLFLAHQNLSQLENGLRQAIRANVQTSLVFQCSVGDASELSSDIVSSLPRDKLRRLLATQPVGTAFLNRRAQRSVQVATVHSPDPHISSDELANRIACLQVSQPVASQIQPTALPTEVRHERRPYVP